MTIIEIENNLNNLISNFNKETFIFDLLLAYGTPKSTIKRLIGSDHDKLDTNGELVLRKKLYFKVTDNNLHATIYALKSSKDVTKHSPRFIIVTDYETLLAFDTKTDDSLDTEILNITNHYDFFLPLAGMEKAAFTDENPADVKASLKMAKLYDELQKNNEFKTSEDIHALNVFLTRLLFCYFAEDTNIFTDNLFTSSISSHTQSDGSDLNSYLSRLFKIFNTPENKRDANTPAYLSAFPYVNGGLFRDEYKIPKFTARSRSLLLEVGQLQWSQINPDIFGSMIQAVVTPEHRGGMGMHYTSVPNIMKVIEPLFLDELYIEFEKSYENKIKLQNLLNCLAKIKIFDPACGSGNFLIIAYKKLRELEMSILQRIEALSKDRTFVFSEIRLTQFYGIELDDFAHEVAMLSLWLAEHQMNLEFYKAFGRTSPSLPLHDGGNIVHGNATRLNWEEVCPKEDGDEIYILGNPPYLGSSMQNKEQKKEMENLFKKVLDNFKNLDYISCWFYLGSRFIRGTNAKLAFVTTNSISQGEQVALIWPQTLKNDLEIFFAYQSFKWQNNAKDNAGVTVSIIGLSNITKNKKYIFIQNIKYEVENINPYLSQGSNVVVRRTNKILNGFPELVRGSMPTDDGNFELNSNDIENLVQNYPYSEKFIKPFMSGGDYLNGNQRWCLWIKDSDLEEANCIPFIQERLNKVKEFRLKSDAPSTVDYAKFPNRFRQISFKESPCIIVPLTSSERRKYIPFGFVTTPTVVTNSAGVIYDAEPWIFGVISSLMHMAWVRAVGGSLETRIRYSSVLCYNTFPFPNISQKQKDEITELVFAVLDEREKHSQKTLAQLYDPDKMPEGLKKAHHNLDIAIEQCYRSKPFESDEERLEYLFKMYEEMTNKEEK